MKQTLAFILVFFSLAVAPAQVSDRPNIVFIMADDLGFNEVGAYGQEKIRTPNLNRLASEGLRFTRHYSGAPVCAPARAVLLTGRHSGHCEIRDNKRGPGDQRFRGQHPLSAGATTFATLLKNQGYRTGAFGKWGLGNADTSGAPGAQGFDRFFGYLCQRNAHSFYPPYLDSSDRQVPLNDPAIPGHARKPEGKVRAGDYRGEVYAPDLVRERALKFLREHKDGPFLLYLPFIEPHLAMHPPQGWIDHYPREWDRGRRPYRGENGYLPHPRPRAGYAAMISHLDDHVGAVLDSLDNLGLAANTIVVFTSDNGTTHPGSNPAFHIGGVDAEFFNSTGDLRGWKGSVYEGGLRVPTIVRWPGHTRPGSVTDYPSYAPDWFPTFCQLAGAKVSDTMHLDGVDLTPLLSGRGKPVRKRPMVWEFHGYGGQLAVMAGPWKAVRQKVKTPKPSDWELYHLERDPAETDNLAQDQPGKLRELVAAFENDRTPSAVLPLLLYDPSAPAEDMNRRPGGTRTDTP